MRHCKKCNTNIEHKHKNAKFCNVQCNRDFFNTSATVEVRECKSCNKDFISTRKDKVFCSRYCGDYYSRSSRRYELNAYFKALYHNDISRRLSTNIRSRLNKALKGAYKVDSVIGSLGCSPEELKKHLESQFLPDMSWGNYSLKGWHIDHIKPLASFDLTNQVEFREACHYTNLQPLWAEDNLSKGARYG